MTRRPSPSLLRIVLAVGASFAALAVSTRAAPVDFRREVLPILSDACFRCHGPDEGTREAGLRLDQREGVFRTKNELTVVAPGKPEASELVLRIASKDADEVMPPPDSPRSLKPAEIETLRRWVAEGAPWSGHWAFDPIATVQPPAIPPEHAKKPIDAFVAARLAAEKIVPAPAADRARLLRRVTFDLTGLPPTPAEVDAFLSDRSASAFEQAVDRLLASPHYGERMATEWLDLARYADTHGYQMDRPRAMWAWRDWVISAFNDNLPFDRFATWQIAGDLLPNATKTQRLATAFNRLHNQNEEGGIVEEEYRMAYVSDRVTTFGTAFLGLTFECARCHDHKYDPISQKDFYALSAFFQNIDEAGQISYVGFADAMPVPTLLLTSEEDDRLLTALRDQAKVAEQKVTAARAAAGDAFAAWLRWPGAMPETLPGLAAHFDFDTQADGKPLNRLNRLKGATLIETPKFETEARGTVAVLDGENGFRFPGVGHFNRTEAFSLGLWIRPPETFVPRTVVLHRTKAPADAGSRGYEILLENGRVAFALNYLWPGAALKIVSRAKLAPNAWSHLTVTYDGSSRAAGATIYLNGEPVEAEVVRDGLFKDIVYERSEPDLTIGQRFRDVGFAGGRVDDLTVFERALAPIEVAELAGRGALTQAFAAMPEKTTPAQRAGLFAYFTAVHFSPTREASASLQAIRQEINRLISRTPEAMVMHEMPQPKRAFVLGRGAYDAPGEEVFAATPSALPPMAADAPRNRLGLARWLVDPANPLMARVTVNRLWQQMFGTGLVETSDNFGLQGAPPSHPELLDWLARDFMAKGWNVKALLREFALSETYRRASRADADTVARDPNNQWLARSSARRLTAEMLRDQALAVSGLLVEKIGGPAVKPYQPPGLWEEIAMGRPKYVQGTGADLHRRSLYSFWKRTVPPPAMMLFDAADRSGCTVKRQSTNTPLQALALLNDVQLVEAARVLGERLLREGGGTRAAQIAWAFRAVCSRTATPAEMSVLEALFAEQHAIFAADEKAAEALLGIGEPKSDSTLPAADRAAATILAQALLNFDEALMRR